MENLCSQGIFYIYFYPSTADATYITTIFVVISRLIIFDEVR